MPLIPRRKRPDAFIPVVSMSDIAFLLIVFFLLSTQFMQEGHLQYKLPKAKNIKTIENDQISIVIDKDGKTYVNGYFTLNVQQEIAKRLEGRNNPEDRVVILKCDRSVPDEKYLPVLQEINSAQAYVVLVTEESRETKKKREKENE